MGIKAYQVKDDILMYQILRTDAESNVSGGIKISRIFEWNENWLEKPEAPQIQGKSAMLYRGGETTLGSS